MQQFDCSFWMQTRMNLTSVWQSSVYSKSVFLPKTKVNYIVLYLIGQGLQEDILTAICDRPDTWTRRLLNMERPHNSSGCLENEGLENDDRRPKNEYSGNEDPGQPLLILKFLKTRTYRWWFVVLQLNWIVKIKIIATISTRTERQNIDPHEVSTDRPLVWAAYSDIHL